MNEKPALHIEGLACKYQERRVLHELSCSITAGEYVGLVGVNGAGKSTLIKAILDFIAIEKGAISIFGQSHRQPEARNNLAFLPENFQPPYYLKGKDFLRYMAELHGTTITMQEMEQSILALDLELSALDKSVRQFSKGMSQKLGLAACFLSQRPLLLLDEPMSGLDPKARAYLKQYLQTLKQNGQTLFFSTHLLNDVDDLCDRIVILHNGTIMFNGTTTECCDRFAEATLEAAYMRCIESNEMANADSL